MLPALVSLKSLIRRKSYNIDYPLFRLHYQATVCVLLAFCLILTAKILFGDTIDCKSRMHGMDKFWDNLCYSQGTYTTYVINRDDIKAIGQPPPPPPPEEEKGLIATFAGTLHDTLFGQDPEDFKEELEKLEKNLTQSKTVINYTHIERPFPLEFLHGTDFGNYLRDNFRLIHRMIKSKIGEGVPYEPSVRYLYPGIAVPRAYGDFESTTYWHRYYQYIPVMLFLQAILFYFPHYLWRVWENGIISTICKQLHDHRFSPTEFIECNHHIIDYLQNCFTLNKTLVYKYYLCHVLLFINLIFQIIVLNTIFNNQFITYGLDVFHYLFIDHDIYGLRGVQLDIYDINSPMDFVFPKITGCTIQTLSQAGKRPDTLQFLCVLPLNILHDKFFLMLWFWFLMLGILTVIQIMFDAIYTTLPCVRSYLFKRRFGSCTSSSLPQLFLLDLIGSNSDRFAFGILLKKMQKEDWVRECSENESLV